MGSWIMLFLVSIVITPVRMETTDAVRSKERYIYFMTLITCSFITKPVVPDHLVLSFQPVYSLNSVCKGLPRCYCPLHEYQPELIPLLDLLSSELILC